MVWFLREWAVLAFEAMIAREEGREIPSIDVEMEKEDTLQSVRDNYDQILKMIGKDLPSHHNANLPGPLGSFPDYLSHPGR